MIAVAHQAFASLCSVQVPQMLLKQQLDSSVDQLVLFLRFNNRAAETLESGDLAPAAWHASNKPIKQLWLV